MPSGLSSHSSITLRFSADYAPAPFILATADQQWVSAVKSASNGDINIQSFYGGALYPSGDAEARAVAAGQLDLAALNGPNLEGLIRDMPVIDTPFVTRKLNTAIGLTKPKSALFQVLQAEAKKKGMYILPVPVMVSGMSALLTTKSVGGLAGLQSLKMRTPGDELTNRLLIGLKSNPIALAPSDLATALRTGTVDGAFATTTFANGVAKGLVKTDIPLGWGGSGYLVVANLNRWNQLSGSQRSTLVSTLSTVQATEAAGLQASEDAAEQAFAAQGSAYTVHKMNAADNKVLRAALLPLQKWQVRRISKPAYKAFVRSVKALGLKPPPV
jgi:TRAP-type C4-dicarboxylate transport system substrate-binding protein